MISLKKILIISCCFLVILTVGAWILFSLKTALSVSIGGILSVASFAFAYRDVETLSTRIVAGENPEDRQFTARKERKNHAVKFLLRLAVIGIVLFFIIKSGNIDIIGLIMGLSTVVLAIIVTATNALWHYYFGWRR